MQLFLRSLTICSLVTCCDLFFCNHSASAQIPTEGDCLGAIQICEPVYTTPNPGNGTGNYVNEIGPNTCQLLGELNSIWLKFSVLNAGDLAFTITPVALYSDYDWALYDLTGVTCADVLTNGSLLLSCNSSQYAVTGISATGIGNWNGPGFTYAFNYLFPVIAGNDYYLQINNVNGSPGGFTIDFTASTALIANCGSLNIAGSATSVCEKFCVDFTDSSTNNPTAWQWFFPGGTPASSTLQHPTSICYAIPGIYDVTLVTTNAAGNDTLTLPSYITVNPTPPFPVITQNGTTLTSSAATFYQWQFNSYDIPGATSQSYIVTQSGAYTIVISDSNGCKNASSIDVEITGIGSKQNDFSITIAPNPFISETVISFVLPQSQNITLEILDLQGRMIKTLQQGLIAAGQHSLTWNRTNAGNIRVSDGIYFLRMQAEGGSWTYPLSVASE